MTRKHYKVAADAIAKARQKITSEVVDDNARKVAMQAITELECNLVHMFAGNNPRFSVVKFLAASK